MHVCKRWQEVGRCTSQSHAGLALMMALGLQAVKTLWHLYPPDGPSQEELVQEAELKRQVSRQEQEKKVQLLLFRRHMDVATATRIKNGHHGVGLN